MKWECNTGYTWHIPVSAALLPSRLYCRSRSFTGSWSECQTSRTLPPIGNFTLPWRVISGKDSNNLGNIRYFTIIFFSRPTMILCFGMCGVHTFIVIRQLTIYSWITAWEKGSFPAATISPPSLGKVILSGKPKSTSEKQDVQRNERQHNKNSVQFFIVLFAMTKVLYVQCTKIAIILI